MLCVFAFVCLCLLCLLVYFYMPLCVCVNLWTLYSSVLCLSVFVSASLGFACVLVCAFVCVYVCVCLCSHHHHTGEGKAIPLTLKNSYSRLLHELTHGFTQAHIATYTP